MIWTLVIVMLSAQDGTGTQYHVSPEKPLTFERQQDCQPVMEAYNAANQRFIPQDGPPWVYSYAVCEETQ